MWFDKEYCDVNVLLGKVLKSVYKVYDNEIHFITEDNMHYVMYHEQDCCESVAIEDINGDLKCLVGNPILLADESSNSVDPPKYKYDESYTWTFYRFATIKGYVDIRWYGESNGYYSESVNFGMFKQ